MLDSKKEKWAASGDNAGSSDDNKRILTVKHDCEWKQYGVKFAGKGCQEES